MHRVGRGSRVLNEEHSNDISSLGFVKNYSGILAVRFMLGLLEGPMFPGIVLYLSGFYTRKELSFRYG